MSNLDSIKSAGIATEQAFIEWFTAKPWCMSAIVFACLVVGFVVGKLL